MPSDEESPLGLDGPPSLAPQLCVTLKISEAQHLGSRKQLYSVIALSLAVTLSLVTGMWALKFIPVSFDQVRHPVRRRSTAQTPIVAPIEVVERVRSRQDK